MKNPVGGMEGFTETSGPASAATPMREGLNGGQLRTGGTNRGGPGRPPNILRELCRQSGYGGLAWARRVVDGKIKTTVLLRLKALDLVLKYGIGTRVEVETPQTPVQFSFLVAPDVAEELRARNLLRETGQAEAGRAVHEVARGEGAAG